MSKKNKYLWGTDPEASAVYEIDGKVYALPPYFFRNELGVSATDDKKHPVFLTTDFWKLHEDGANFEMAIRPSHNPKDLWDTIQDCAQATSAQILQHFPDHCLPVLRFLPTVGWEVNRWRNMPEDFFMSTRFGCDPDNDAFNFDTVSRTVDASEWGWRYDGGHIHISGSPWIMKEPIMAVKSLAVTAGCAAIANSTVPELEKLRTHTYGKPGKYRIQKYGRKNPFGKDYAVGIEYRTISATWANDWDIAKEVFEWAEIGIRELLENGLAVDILPEVEDPAISAILGADQGLAQEVLEFIKTKV